MSIISDYRSRRDDRWSDHQLREELRWSFRQACVGAGCAVRVDGIVSGTGWHAPEATTVQLGSGTDGPARLTVRMPEGLVPAHLQQVARYVAPHIGGITLCVNDRGHGWCLVDVLRVDPLAAGTVAVPAAVSSASHEPILLGVAEDGAAAGVHLASAAHLIVQGATGSGKSVGLYGVLGQLVDAPDVLVAGSDITALLLGPWAVRDRHRGLLALGTGCPDDHVEVLERLVAEMDARVADLPLGHDSVQLGEGRPLIVCVIEETPGLYRLLDGASTKDNPLGKRARALIGRLLGEGRKAGIRVVLITQRADTSIIGGYERGQASHKISFRVDSLDAVKMLHPDATPDIAAEHATAMPGVALLSAPGVPLTRFRAPLVTYGDYCAAVASPGHTDGPELAAAA